MVVLGIVAAITVPVLRNSLDEKRYRIPLKKVYSVLSEALDNATHNSNDYTGSKLLSSVAPTLARKLIKEELGVNRVCCADGSTPDMSFIYPEKDENGDPITIENCIKAGTVAANKCFTAPMNTYRATNLRINTTEFTNMVGFEMKDGTSVVMFVAKLSSAPANNSTADREFQSSFGNVKDTVGLLWKNRTPFTASVNSNSVDFYYLFLVDVNGKNNSPNQLGKDIHLFVYTKSDGLLPAGADTGLSSCVNTTHFSCTYSYMNSEEN